MSCKTYKEILHSYVNNELNTLETEAAAKHLESCIDCRREVQDIRKLKLVMAACRPETMQLNGLKDSIMSAIKSSSKASVNPYDIKVMGRLGASMVACGVVVLFLNFSTLGSSLAAHTDKIDFGMQDLGQRIIQPMAAINKGLTDMSNKIVNLNGITYRLQQKIRGGM